MCPLPLLPRLVFCPPCVPPALPPGCRPLAGKCSLGGSRAAFLPPCKCVHNKRCVVRALFVPSLWCVSFLPPSCAGARPVRGEMLSWARPCALLPLHWMHILAPTLFVYVRCFFLPPARRSRPLPIPNHFACCTVFPPRWDYVHESHTQPLHDLRTCGSMRLCCFNPPTSWSYPNLLIYHHPTSPPFCYIGRLVHDLSLSTLHESAGMHGAHNIHAHPPLLCVADSWTQSHHPPTPHGMQAGLAPFAPVSRPRTF